jgi:hypothetical protein
VCLCGRAVLTTARRSCRELRPAREPRLPACTTGFGLQVSAFSRGCSRTICQSRHNPRGCASQGLSLPVLRCVETVSASSAIFLPPHALPPLCVCPATSIMCVCSAEERHSLLCTWCWGACAARCCMKQCPLQPLLSTAVYIPLCWSARMCVPRNAFPSCADRMTCTVACNKDWIGCVWATCQAYKSSQQLT